MRSLNNTVRFLCKCAISVAVSNRGGSSEIHVGDPQGLNAIYTMDSRSACRLKRTLHSYWPE